MFDRRTENELIEALAYFPVVGIIGPRQVGKTTISKKLVKKLDKNFVYLDLENPKDLSKLEDPVLFFELNEEKCVILDEIQFRKDLFPILRAMVDKKREAGRFIILGSATPELIRSSSESLAGRIFYQELTPFNFLEINSTYSMSDHWVKGGFPGSLLANNKKTSLRWRNSFIRTYIERDLPLLGLNVSPVQLTRLWKMLSHLNGQILNYEMISKSLGITGPTAKKYVQFLKEAFILRLLEPYHVNIKKRLVKSPKIYIRDTGLLHQMLGISDFDDLFGNPMIGFSWEAYVIEQICSSLSDDYEVFYYRTQQGAELDLIVTKASKPLFAVEIKFSSSPKLSVGNLQSLEELNIKKGYIITYDSDEFQYAKNITVCSLNCFLDNYLP